MKRAAFMALGIAAVLWACAAQAAENLGLIDFTPDTPAHADSVDANFRALEQAVPVMWASIDQDPASVQYAGPMPVVVNSLMGIAVPHAGTLLINGSAFIFNPAGSAPEDFLLNVRVDGSPPPGAGVFLAASGFVPAQPSSTNTSVARHTLSFTYAVEVTAGSHDIEQTLSTTVGPGITYNKNNLTVIFLPALPGGMPIQDPGLPASADTAPELGQ